MPLSDQDLVELLVGFVDRRRKDGYAEADAVQEAWIDLAVRCNGPQHGHEFAALLLRRLRVVLEERDRARDIAVTLEQELAHVDDLIGQAWFEVSEHGDDRGTQAYKELVSRIRVPAC